MVSFSDNLRDFIAMYNDAGRTFAPDTMQGWFKTKKARMQSYHEKMFFGFRKTAVVLVGVSTCGKSRFAKEFLKSHKGFKYISFDDCMFEAEAEVNYSGEDVTNRGLELLDAKFEKYGKSNILVDGLVVSVEKRAALMKTLEEMKYKIYVIYFTDEYNEKHIKFNIVSRSVDHVLFAKMVASDPDNFAFLMSLDLNMIEVHAKKEGISMGDVIVKYSQDLMVKQEIQLNYINYETERKTFCVDAQEAAKAFMWGADYYYEIK